MQGHAKAFKAVSVIFVFSILSFLLSILLQVILAATFGVKREMDAYLLSVAIPVMAISLLKNTSEVVFVPFFKDISLTDTEENIAKSKNLIFNFILFGLVIISLLSFLFATKIIKYLTPGFNAEERYLTVSLFKIMIPSMIFGGLSGFLTSVYYYQEKFFLPAIVTILNNAFLIFTFLVLYPLLKIKALALGMVLGYACQFLILLPIMPKLEKRYFNLRAPQVSNVFTKFFQIFVGGAILGLIVLFERLLASRLPKGSISYLGYSSKIISLLLLLPTAALPTVLLPNLSGHFAMQNLDRLRHNLALGIRIVFFIIFPICVWLFIYRIPLVYILLERGNFDRMATYAVATTLVYYMGVLLGVSLSSITGRGYFAIQNTFIPAVIMSVSFLFYILIAIPLSRLFSYSGLALALSITILTGWAVDLFTLRYLLKGIEGKAILSTAYKVFTASAVMGSAAWALRYGMTLSCLAENKLFVSIKVGVGALISFSVYLMTCFMIKSEELNIIYASVMGKLAKRSDL